MINEIISIILQILVFTLIPFLVFLIKKKTLRGFLDYIGLKSTNKKAVQLALLSSTLLFVPIIIILLINPDFKEIMHHPESMTGKFREMGFGLKSAIFILLVSILKTALSEEIFFRGFVAKRLIAVTNYKIGNMIQSILFGVLHVLLFLGISSNPFFLFIIFLFPAIGAYVMTYINEKKSNGSIIPSWIMHAFANIMSYSIISYLL